MANNAFTQLTGYRISEIKGQGANLLKSGRHDNAFYKRMWDEVLHKGFWEGDIWNLVLSGEIRCHHLNISTVRDESLEPQYYVGMLQAVHFMAQHDILTGLANRSMLMEQLERHLALAKRHGRGEALLYLDLDGFKSVNDQFGHKVGELVLKMGWKLVEASRAPCPLPRSGQGHCDFGQRRRRPLSGARQHKRGAAGSSG